MPIANPKPATPGPDPGGGSEFKPLKGQQEQGQQPQSNWNPSGYWPDPYESRFGKEFRPHEFISSLINSPEGKAYGNPEATAQSFGVQTAREGEAQATEEAKQEAANQGLGRGFAEQASSDIRQQTNQNVSEMVLGAHLEGQTRRWQQAAMLASSLLEANKARFNAYLNKQAASAAQTSGIISAIGDIIGGALGGGGIFGGGGNNSQSGNQQPAYVEDYTVGTGFDYGN